MFVEEAKHAQSFVPRVPKAEAREKPRWGHIERAWKELLESAPAAGLPWGKDGAWTQDQLKEELATTPVKYPDGPGMWLWTETK